MGLRGVTAVLLTALLVGYGVQFNQEIQALGDLAPASAAECTSTGDDGAKIATKKSFTGSASLRPPGELTPGLSAADARARARDIGHYSFSDSTASCKQILLGIYDDTTAGPMSRLAWAVLYKQFGRMAGGRGTSPVDYEQVVIIDALTGDFITSIEYPSDQTLPPPPCNTPASNPLCTNPGGVGPRRS